MIKGVVLLCVFFIANLNSKENFFDISYVSSSDNFEGYSLSYARFILPRIVLGVGYNTYKLNTTRSDMVKTSFEMMFKDMSFSLKPFYSFQKGSSRFYGAKTAFNLTRQGYERVTTYGMVLSYAWESDVKKKEILFAHLFMEKNFYDEFFIILGVGGSLFNGGFKGRFDRSGLFNLNYAGYVTTNPYSTVTFSAARSFKPDFNSYLYLSFDKINAGMDGLDSYLVGLRTYLEEKESYYLDLSFNLADKKVLSDERIWKVVVGGVF